ncbi:helix-turn-helix domain-containing protein [Mesorhizobium sp. M6A.T.Ca.TU.002.02.2.1]|nr:helix-turn-helix domain-containing protein [Mesorhizobium sp. M6A.T.Ca.TU.002.02.2.1]
MARDVENARLIQIIKEFQRHRFGRRAGTLPEDQLLLGLEEAEQIEAAGDEELAQTGLGERQAPVAKRRANRGGLPPHLPRGTGISLRARQPHDGTGAMHVVQRLSHRRAVAREALEAVAPMAIEAALEAERMQLESEAKRRQMIEMDLQQARYEASPAERRYAACDPENRLIAAQLERSWEATLRRVETREARLSEVQRLEPVDAVPDFTGLAQDLEGTWNAPGVDMRCRQQLLRALIKGIVADVDDDARDVILTIHWHGGQHSQVRVRKPKSGEHGQRTPEEALAIMRSMATRWSDAEIAATLNRMGMQTGQGKTWTARRVQSLRTVHKISGYRSSDKNGEWLTMSDAAAKLGVSHVKIRRFIRDGLLPAEQVMRGAPYQIRASDLEEERIKADLARNTPRRIHDDNQESLFSAI